MTSDFFELHDAGMAICPISGQAISQSLVWEASAWQYHLEDDASRDEEDEREAQAEMRRDADEERWWEERGKQPDYEAELRLRS